MIDTGQRSLHFCRDHRRRPPAAPTSPAPCVRPRKRRSRHPPPAASDSSGHQCYARGPALPKRVRNIGWAVAEPWGKMAGMETQVNPTLVEIREAGLLLRPWQAADADEVFRACQDPEIQRWTMVPQPYMVEHAIDYVTTFTAQAWANGTGAPFGVFDPATGQLLGACGLVELDRDRRHGRDRLLGRAVGPRSRGGHRRRASGGAVGAAHPGPAPARVAGRGRQPRVAPRRGADRGPLRGRAAGRPFAARTAGMTAGSAPFSPAICARRARLASPTSYEPRRGAPSSAEPSRG